MYNRVEVAYVNRLELGKVTKYTFQETVNKPHRGSGSVMDKRATLELNCTDIVVEVHHNCPYGWLVLALLIIQFKYHHCCHICTVTINLSLNNDTSDEDTIDLVAILIRHARERW